MTTVDTNKETFANRIELNKAVIRKFIDAYNNRNLDIFDELVVSDYIDHTHQTTGREEFKHLFTKAFEGFPDWHEDIQEMIAEDDNVWVRVKATGTHKGDWNLFGVPLPPTGNRVEMEMVFIWRVVNGKLVEGREVDDSVEFLRQLGLIEYTDNGQRVFTEV
jgi:predicted ester cyclase